MITYKLAVPGQGTQLTLKGVALIGLGIAAANRYMEVARNAGRTDIAIIPEQLREEAATVSAEDFQVAGEVVSTLARGSV